MNAGTHIYINQVGYSHHGLYIGDERVIHYEGHQEFALFGQISEVSLRDFSQGNPVHEAPVFERVYSESESVARAQSRLGEECYNLFLNNCEQFVNWCIFGVPVSVQVGAAALATTACAKSAIEGVAGTTLATGLVASTTTVTAGTTLSLAATSGALPILPVVLIGGGLVAAATHAEEVEEFALDVIDAVDDLVMDGLDALGEGCSDAFEAVCDFFDWS